MKVRTLLEVNDEQAIKWDKERSIQGRLLALKVQQAIAELDGWELNLIPPKPMDLETGEVFSWTGIAKHDDGNTVKLKISKLDDADPGDVYFLFDIFHKGHNPSCPLSWSIEQIGVEFIHLYDAKLSEIIDDFEDDFSDRLKTLITNSGVDFSKRREVTSFKEEARREIYIPIINHWLTEFSKMTNDFVNSRELAEKLVSRIEDAWESMLQQEIENAIERGHRDVEDED